MWEAIKEVITNAGEDHDPTLWDTTRHWCLCASQAGQNGKSLMAFEVDSVVIDDEEFDKWVGDKLDQALGRRPAIMNTPMPTTMPQAQTNPGPRLPPPFTTIGIGSGAGDDALHASGSPSGWRAFRHRFRT